MNSKKHILPHLLTPILIACIMISAALVSHITIQTFKREQDNIKSYTHARMKSLILDLESRVMSVEAAMMTVSHTSHATIADSVTLFRHLDNLVQDQQFIRYAGIEIWNGDIHDSLSYVMCVTEQAGEDPVHFSGVVSNSMFKEEQLDKFYKAYDSGNTVWSHPYDDRVFSKTRVVTGYQRVLGKDAMLYTDLDLEMLLETIDSLQFYENSKFYIEIPDEATYTRENGKLVKCSAPDVDERKFTKISAHYRHLDFDIVNVVPNERIYSTLWRNMAVVFTVLLLSLLLLALIVRRALKSSRAQLAHSIEESHAQQMARKQLEDEIAIAGRIQKKMLTDPDKPVHYALPDCMTADILSRIIPAREVGGDLYEYRLMGDRLFVCVGDVSGKGIPASVVMTMCSTLFHAFVSNVEDPHPAELLGFLNRQICRRNEELMFVTMWAGAIDLKTGMLEYASAGHNAPVVVSGGKASFLEMSQGVPLGMFEDSEYPRLEYKLSPYDALVLYTDGITEAENPDNVLFGDEKLLQTCGNTPSVCPDVLCHAILKAVNNHSAGHAQSDDITLLCVTLGGRFAQLNGIGDVKALHTLVHECSAPDEAALVIEEAAANAFMHGGATFLSAEYHDGVFTVIDDGDNFDATAFEIPVTNSLNVSGRGIMLMRMLCSEINFSRLNDDLNISSYRLKGKVERGLE